MNDQPGYKVRRLAKLLAKSLPDRNGLAVIWPAEEIYPATGSWRSNVNLDVWRWEAFGHYVDERGVKCGVAYSIGSYATITELIKEDLLVLHGDEVYGAPQPATT